MKILYIANEVVPGQNGGSVHAWEVASHLVRLGAEVTLVAHRRESETAREAIDGVRIERANLRLFGKTVPARARSRLESIAPSAPDLILDRFLTTGGLGARWSKALGVPLALEVNSPHTEELIWRYPWLRGPLGAALRRRTASQFAAAALIISPSEAIIPEQARGRLLLTDWGVSLERFHPALRGSDRTLARRRRLRLEERPVAAFVGSFRPWHGAQHLPEIIQRVRAALPQAAFLLVGDGPLRAEVEREIRKRGLSGAVVSVGGVPYKDVPEWMAVADVGLAPFDPDAYAPLKRFGFYWSPLKIFEYMACGLPVITSDILESRGPKNREGGRLARIIGATGGATGGESGADCAGAVLRAGDWEAFAEATAALLQRADRGAAEGRNGRGRVERSFGWDAHAKRLLDAFARTVDRFREGGEKA